MQFPFPKNGNSMKTTSLLLTIVLFTFASTFSQQLPGENYPDGTTIGLWHMNDSTGSTVYDSGDSSHTGTASGTTIVAGRFGRGRSFADQPSYIDLGPHFIGYAFTYWSLESWIKISAWPTDQGTIFYDGVDGEMEVGTASDSSLYFSVHTSGGWYEIRKRTLRLDRWYHVCATLDNSTHIQSLYVNGVLEAQTIITGQLVQQPAPYRPTIGSFTTGSYFYGFLGLIDEVRVSGSVRTPQEFDLQLPPGNLLGNQAGFGINLNWSNGGGRTALLRYRVYRGRDSTSVAILDSTGSTSYADTNLTDGVTYFYRVSAVDVTGFEGAPSSAFPITFHSLPFQVQLLYPANGSTGVSPVAPFVWRRAIGQIDRYWFELATDSLFSSKSIDSTLTDTSTVVSGLSNGQFWWRVRAHSLAGWGGFSQTGRFRIVILSIDDHVRVPSRYSLSQNYPNPFNPSTTIRYGLPERSQVNLTVFNTLGQMVAVLVNEKQEPGDHEVTFDGSATPSGIYFCRLRAGGVQLTTRLSLLK